MSDLDTAFQKFEDATWALISCLIAVALARIGALVGPLVPVIGAVLVLGAIVCLGMALIYLVLALGLRQAIQADTSGDAVWSWEQRPEESDRYMMDGKWYWRGTDMPVSPDPCHCTHCMNKRKW